MESEIHVMSGFTGGDFRHLSCERNLDLFFEIEERDNFFDTGRKG